MQKEFIPYEQALELKELGFDEPCFGYYNTTWSKQNELLFPQYAGELENWNEMIHLCSAPLYQQAFRWFREKHGMLGCIEFVEPEYGGDYGYKLYYKPGYLYIDHWNKGFKTYEEAELACLKKLIEIVKHKKD